MQTQDTALVFSDYCTHHLLPFVSATFVQVIENDPSIAKDFLADMCAEEITGPLNALGHIPDIIARLILRDSKDRKDANQHLLKYLNDMAEEKAIIEILQYASQESGYGKMNALAKRILHMMRFV